MRRTVALVLFAVPFGCSLTGLDGLTGGEGPTDDGGLDASEAASPDALVDGGLDSTTDAQPSVCATPHTFCDDFDDGGLGARWSSQRTVNGALSLEAAMGGPPNRALLATATPSDASAAKYDVALFRSFPGGFSDIHCEFDVMADPTPSPKEGAGFGVFVTGAGSVGYFALWNIDRGRLYEEFDQPLSSSIETPIPLPTPGRWTRIAVDLHLRGDAAVGLLTLSYDGRKVASVPPLGEPTSISGVGFKLGIADGYPPLNNPWHIRYDNAWCDIL